jgi:hypothetical protein
MRQRNIELPDLSDLPQTTCKQCGKSKICGLFSPAELTRADGPRCMLCCGEMASPSKTRPGQSSFFNPRSNNSANSG